MPDASRLVVEVDGVGPGNMAAGGAAMVSPGCHGYTYSVWGETEKESQEELCWQMGVSLLEWESLAHGDRYGPLLHCRFCGSDFNVSISSSFK